MNSFTRSVAAAAYGQWYERSRELLTPGKLLNEMVIMWSTLRDVSIERMANDLLDLCKPDFISDDTIFELAIKIGDMLDVWHLYCEPPLDRYGLELYIAHGLASLWWLYNMGTELVPTLRLSSAELADWLREYEHGPQLRLFR